MWQLWRIGDGWSGDARKDLLRKTGTKRDACFVPRVAVMMSHSPQAFQPHTGGCVRSNLRWKWLFITIVVAGCVVGITGLPTSFDALAENLKQNVRLGLDLKGGSHIVLQVQVQDAFKAEADAAIEALKEAFRKENVSYVSIERNDPNSIAAAESIQVNIKGVPAGQINDFRRLTTDRVGQQWLLVPENTRDYRLNLRREAAVKLRHDTLTQSIRTMERKVNGLGVAEAAVQERGGSGGETEIMVQLPGVDDPGRVKGILQTSAMLELCDVKGGPFPSHEAVLSQHGGILPLNSKIVRGSSRVGGAENWWLLGRSPVITGRDLRDARAQHGEFPGRWETGFSLTGEAAGRFERFTRTNIGNRLAIVLDNTVISAPTIQAAISDQGQIRICSQFRMAAASKRCPVRSRDDLVMKPQRRILDLLWTYPWCALGM